MLPEQTNNAAQSGEKRLFSDHLMMELGHALIEKRLLSRESLDDINSRRALTGDPLDRLLIREGVVEEPDLLRVLAGLCNMPFLHIADISIGREAVKAVPARVALRYNVMPLDLEGGVLRLAACAVPTPATADALRMVLNCALDWVLCTEGDINRSIKHFYGLGAETIDSMDAMPKTEIELPGGADVSDGSTDEGVIRFVHQIIAEAIGMNATDVHIEPFEEDLRLRYRVDGVLQVIPMPHGVNRIRKAIASCVKIMAEMDIAERRKPHDGRIKVRSGTEEFDLRVSILPTRYGETVNMRILNRKTMFIDLEHLGLSARQAPAIEYLSELPHGVVLLTGPTGSGKTTTLYALLSRVSNTECKIITVEDPIEYQLQGITQIQVHSQIGLTFASVLRSILRHDPDIILIGEIRDMETADIAVRASLTGHLVFSTLHTNDAPSAVTRLIDMGVEPYLVSSCLEGVIAQRLVRRVCNDCREEMTPDEVILEEIRSMYPKESEGAKYYKGHGCPSCGFTGYRGRIALFEMMLMNDRLRGLIVRQRPSNEIKHAAVEQGLVTLRQDGWSRVLSGMTTVEEVVRVARKSEPPSGAPAE
ncbi:MAG: type II/IV secretion system protein [Lentisphaerae bacterium]|nr:type II/IV secretion system protein [Lentisphaerota bacterium]